MPTIASDLRLTPQARTILQHLKRHGDITPMKALTVYSIPRLASCICEIRKKAGYSVKTEVAVDDMGGRYGLYTLIQPAMVN
jgi:hypothetical protein